jgi:hypothetical protein
VAAAGSNLDDHASASRTRDLDGLSTSPVDKTNAGSTDESKLPPSQNVGLREIADPAVSVARHSESGSDAIIGDPQSAGQEATSSPVSGVASDPLGAASLAAWAPNAAVPAFVSAANTFSSGLGSDGRAENSAVHQKPQVPIGGLSPGLEVAEPAAGGAQMVLDLAGDGLVALPGPVEYTDRDAPAWASLLEGALRSDWQKVDGELRQFLSRLGGLAQHTDENGARPMWPVWIGAATALILAHRASYWRRRFFGRPVQDARWKSPRRPVPVGPWPLGPL